MNIQHNGSGDFDSLAPPTRARLIQAGRYFFPGVGGLLTITGLIYFLASGENLLVGLWVSVCLLFLGILLALDFNKPNVQKKNKRANPFLAWLVDWLGGTRIGLVGFIGSVLLLLACAVLLVKPQPLSIFFWPILVPPLEVFIGRYHGKSSKLLTYVLTLTIIGMAGIFLTDLIAIRWQPGKEATPGFPLQAVISMFWFTLFVFEAFYRIFRASLFKARENSVRAVLKDIVSRPESQDSDLTQFLENAVSKIYWLQGHHIVSIVLCSRGNPLNDLESSLGCATERAAYSHTLMKIEAVAGVSLEQIKKIQPWPACKGLTGQMVRVPGEPYLLENNTLKPGSEYYEPPDWPIKTRSELVVPIRASGLTFGVIDVQSNATHDFTADDGDALSAIAIPLAAEFQQRLIKKINEDDRKLWKELSRLDDQEAVIKCFGKYASELAGTDLVIYFPMTIGTGIPSHRPFIFGHVRAPERLEKSKHLINLVKAEMVAKEEKFYKDVQTDPGLLGFAAVGEEPFVITEHIHSLCILPITMSGRRLGALLLAYHGHESFGDLRRLAINILTQTLTHHISRIRYRDPFFKKLSQPRFRLHHILNLSNLSKGKLNADLQSLIDQAPDHIKEHAESLRYRILEGYTQAYFEGSVLDIDFEKEELGPRLQSFAGLVCQENRITKPDLRILPFVDELIEKETPELKVILMALATEGSFNAIKHSNADFIEIHIDRQPACIQFSVLNDIKVQDMPDPDKFKGSKTGIIGMINDLETALYVSRREWVVKPDERTIKLVVEIPILPAAA